MGWYDQSQCLAQWARRFPCGDCPRQKLVMRWQGQWQLSWALCIVGLAGYLLMALGATLGGEMGLFAYGAPLNERTIEDGAVRCPWHGSRFTLVAGSVREGPTCAPVPSYEVRMVNDQVEVKMRA
jgi:hypothetical protein